MAETTRPQSIGEQLDKLRQQLDTLKDQLEQNKASVERDKARQNKLGSQITALERVVAELGSLRANALTQITAADYEITVRENQVLQDLADGTEQSLSRDIERIRKDLENQPGEVSKCEKELLCSQNCLVAKRQAVQEKQALFDTAFNAVKSITTEVKGCLADIQRSLTDLRDASSTGNTKKAFVIIQELKYLRDKAKKLSDGTEEKDRIKTLLEAISQLEAAEAAFEAHTAEVEQANSKLKAARERLAALQQSYAADLKKLYAPAPAPAA